MRRLYNFIINNIHTITIILLVWFIPDYFFQGLILSIHAGIIVVLIIFMLIGEIFEWNYDYLPCNYCRDIEQLPPPENFHGFAIHGNAMWFSDKTSWLGTSIRYCPMCGRRLEDDDV